MNVLIAIDSSATAHAALAAALARKWPDETQYRILTVLPGDAKLCSQGNKHPDLHKAHRLIDRATALLEDKYPYSIVVGQIDVGDPATEILNLANAWDADLIIVGSHDRGPIERLFMGSVSAKVLHKARSSVLVARNFDCFLNRVLVAVDNSEGSCEALRDILQTPWPTGTRFHLITVIDPPAMPAFEPNAMFVPSSLEVYQEIERQAQLRVRTAAAEFDSTFGPDRTTCSTVQGQTQQAIVDFARHWQADLIVLGTRGLTGIKARLSGSVSKSVATAAVCSVHVVWSNIVDLPRSKEVNYVATSL